ncbi:HAMP domain-containing protein [Frankia sp. AgB1.9]|uniref:sensor histidine kinase n=1 Tax=unclassified Frankia TaxID=2632575 RepID=UPI001932FB70|nr:MULTISPECIES: ATP-binding protein [unclassified Frankia]MBL7491635.1 HAMP domain-containing protein [Frankia sp. AgW1.1]MBL7553845.1 HAMP domain-containing protein [Frankia sp. AgB1.9]MBL7618017.1 HAMP domain-containing protein [Frankia sp. AgB1.8]
MTDPVVIPGAVSSPPRSPGAGPATRRTARSGSTGPRRRQRWFSRLALRNRMAVLVGIAVTCGMAVVAGVALGVTNVVLRNAIDTQLSSQAALAAHSVRLGPDIPGGTIHLVGVSFSLPLQVIQDDGSIVPPQWPVSGYVRLPVDSEDIAFARDQLDGIRLRTVTVGGTEYRVATASQRISTDEQIRELGIGSLQNPPPPLNLAVQLARPMSDVQQTLRELGLVMLVVGLLGVAGSMLAGMFVARAALKPVDEAAAAAEHVARTQDLSALIPVNGTDEVARLAESLNSMLRALEASKERQRQLIDDASHELRTPLTSLRTNIELLIRSEANPTRALPAADRTALLSDVDGQMRELTGLVSELVELARDEAPVEEVERLDLAEVVAAAVARARRRATTKGIVIEVTSAPSWIDGRPSMLERAVTNLLDNAVKFSPADSTVRVHTAIGEVIVSDEGPGIASADQPHVFERFYRSMDARSLPGSGLGLAIVADAVRTHGGAVAAGPAPGGGARMRMWLPLAPGPPLELPPALPLAGSAPPGGPPGSAPAGLAPTGSGSADLAAAHGAAEAAESLAPVDTGGPTRPR